MNRSSHPALRPRLPLVALLSRCLPAPAACAVSSYAFRVQSLVVNGEPVPLERPCVAIVDTGTTGFVISDTLYDSNEYESQSKPNAALADSMLWLLPCLLPLRKLLPRESPLRVSPLRVSLPRIASPLSTREVCTSTREFAFHTGCLCRAARYDTCRSVG